MYSIGCDVGSQSLKGILLDPSGQVVAQAAAPYDVEYPRPGWAQQDSLDWRRALASVVGELRATASITASQVGVLGLASQVDGLVAVDADAEPLEPPRSSGWTAGPTAQARALSDVIELGCHVRRLTGLNLDASHVAL